MHMQSEADASQPGILSLASTCVAERAPSHNPAIQTVCQANKLKEPVCCRGMFKCVTHTTKLCAKYRNPNWASSQTPPLVSRIFFQPNRTAAHKIMGVKKR